MCRFHGRNSHFVGAGGQLAWAPVRILDQDQGPDSSRDRPVWRCVDPFTPAPRTPTLSPTPCASPRHSPWCVGESVRSGRTTSASSHGLRDAPAKRACRGRLVPSRHKDRVVSHTGLPLPPRTCASAAHDRRPTGGAAPAATRGPVPLLRISHTLRVPGGSRASRWRSGTRPDLRNRPLPTARPELSHTSCAVHRANSRLV